MVNIVFVDGFNNLKCFTKKNDTTWSPLEDRNDFENRRIQKKFIYLEIT